MEGSILTLPLFVPSHAIYDQTGQIMPCIRSAYIAVVLPTLLRAFTLLSTGAWLFRTRSEDVSTICADRRHLAIIDVIQGERDIASCALEKIYLNKRDIPKKSKRRSPKNLPKECSRNKKGSTWPMSKHHRPTRAITQAETDDKESGELFFLKSRDRPIMIWRNNKCINTGWLHPPPLSHRSLDAKEQWQCSHHHQDTWYRRYPAKVSNLQIRWWKFSFSSLRAHQQQELQ